MKLYQNNLFLFKDFLQCFKKETSKITEMGGFIFKVTDYIARTDKQTLFILRTLKSSKTCEVVAAFLKIATAIFGPENPLIVKLNLSLFLHLYCFVGLAFFSFVSTL